MWRLAADCAHLGHNHLGDNGVEDHCDWNGPLLVPDEEVMFSLILPHEDSSFVDLYVAQPTDLAERLVGATRRRCTSRH